MKKILFISLHGLMGLFFSLIANAEEISCPHSITCNYESGVCSYESSGWSLQGWQALETFSDDLVIQLSKVTAAKLYGEYVLRCHYPYGKNSTIDLLPQNKRVKLIGSKWQFSGFGKQNAECSDITSSEECRIEIDG